MKNPPAELARQLLDASDAVLHGDPPPRLEDVARLVGSSRATLYYYFSGRDDLLTFLLTAHAKAGAEAVRSQVRSDDAPPARLRAMVGAMVTYLGEHPGTCAGLLGALGSAGRMNDVLAANDTWVAGPLRELLAEFTVDGAADAANAIMGAILLAVLGRSMAGEDPTDPAFRQRLTEQVVRGVLA